MYLFSIKYPKALENSPGGPNIWWLFHGYKTRVFGSITLLLRYSIEVICLH